MKLFNLLKLTLFFGTALFAADDSCKIVTASNCSSDYPYAVLNSKNENLSGKCYSQFSGALEVFNLFRETGQCSLSTPVACKLSTTNSCASDYPYSVSDASGTLMLNRCYSTLALAYEAFYGLSETGQCTSSVSQKCKVLTVSQCSSTHPYSIVGEDGKLLLNRCYDSLQGAIEVVRTLRYTGQCAPLN